MGDLGSLPPLLKAEISIKPPSGRGLRQPVPRLTVRFQAGREALPFAEGRLSAAVSIQVKSGAHNRLERADFTAQETFDKVTRDLVARFDLFDHFARFSGQDRLGTPWARWHR